LLALDLWNRQRSRLNRAGRIARLQDRLPRPLVCNDECCLEGNFPFGRATRINCLLRLRPRPRDLIAREKENADSSVGTERKHPSQRKLPAIPADALPHDRPSVSREKRGEIPKTEEMWKWNTLDTTRGQLVRNYNCVSAISSARKRPIALLIVSRYSISGSLSATSPAPACT
jgi:hypothetical protein